VKKLLLIICPVLILLSAIQAQNIGQIEKSDIIENIDGKDYYLHFVKEGETLFAIAKAYDITVNDIFSANPESQKGIKPGQILKIRVQKKVIETSSIEEEQNFIYHIVKSKETLFSISKKYNVSIDEIQSINRDLGDYLKVGQTLKIPQNTQFQDEIAEVPEGSQVIHTVEQGETLYAIAREYGITIGEIKMVNPGLNNTLSIGQQIIIPNQNKEEVSTEEKKPENKETQLEEFIVTDEESIFVVARKNAISVDTLRDYNPGLNEAVYMGQVIKIPKNIAYKDYIIHKVPNRDKLVRIAQDYGVDYGLILAMNPEVSKRVKSGDRVKIPVEMQKPPDTDDQQEFESREMEHPKFECEKIDINPDHVFNVALMLPLYLEEVDSLYNQETADVSQISSLPAFRFIQFYEGFKVAIDSVRKKGMNLNLFVYDLDNTPEKVDKVLAASELSSMDLIVGPVFSKDFTNVARFAQTFGIPIVNPLSSRQEIIQNNPNVFKIKPGLDYQVDQLLNYVLENYPRENIVVVRNNKYKYQSEVSYIRNYLNSRRDLRIFIPNEKLKSKLDQIEKGDGDNMPMSTILTENKVLNKDDIEKNLNDSTYFSNIVKEVIYVNDSTTGLEMNLSRVRENVVIALTDEKVFAQELLSKLNKLRLNHNITLFGIPEWESFDNLETKQLLNLNFHSFTSAFVDYNSPRTKKWINDFRDRYSTEPSLNRYAFQGFDIGWYFLNVLFLYGEDFEQCLSDYDNKLIHTEFDFEKTEGNGYENTHWILGKYQDYRFIPTE
jgi:LysM repeat protein